MPFASTSSQRANAFDLQRNHPAPLQTGSRLSSSQSHSLQPLRQTAHGTRASVSISRSASTNSRRLIPWSLHDLIRPQDILTRFPHNSNEFLTSSPATQQTELGVNLNSNFYKSSGNKVVYWNTRSQGQHPFQCTEYAYGRAMERGLFQNNQGIGAAIDGNAGMWDNNVRSSAYANQLSYQPRRNSFVVWEANQAGAGSVGHVGFVEDTFSDGSFLVSEGNWNNQPFHLRLVRPGTEGYTPGTPANSVQFIYL